MASPLRIGILCHPTYGGSGVVASELALSLAEVGHSVHLFSHAVPPRLAKSPGKVHMHLSRGLPYPLFASTPHDLAVTSSVLNVHRSQGLDILHAHYALPHAVSAFLAHSAAQSDRTRPAPRVVTTLHGTDITIVGSDASYAPLTQFVIAASDIATAVSESLARQTRDLFCDETGLVCEIEVIPNFVDTDLFRPEARPRDEPPTAIHISNFRPVKRVPWLVEAFATASRGTDARLLLVGDGPDEPAARERALELGVAERVEFLGVRDDLPGLLARADVFCLTSSTESFGLSALEALATATPVVATRVGGVPEVIDDGETGLLVEAADQDGFAERLRGLLVDRGRARELGEAGRRVAVGRFHRREIVGRYEELYRRMLAQARRRDATAAGTRADG
ncbi:MAG: N-acetyl-alpha-D-glucosaminyl L-malate synthase BshA [Planctomycetota bacterium]